MVDDPNSPQQPSIPSARPKTGPDAGMTPSAKPLYSTSAYSRRSTPPPPPPNLRETPLRERTRKRRSKSRSGTDWLWVLLASAVFGFVLLISLSAMLIVRTTQGQVEVIPTADVLAMLPTAVIVRSNFSSSELGDSLVLPDGSSIALKPWDGVSRFTMVLAGLDRRPGESGLAHRTDTLMLLSLDPASNSMGILSIPRDLYVQVPGFSSLQRINTPMVYGESREPGYGPRLLMQTVQLNLGMRVNDYLVLDFQAFIDIVNILGGVEINNPTTINDRLYPDMNYGYDPFFLPAGKHFLNGYDALRYARTRHGDSDINRAQRQQQTLFAIRDRILNLEMLPSLILQAPALWQSFRANVYTGLSLEQVIQLGLYVKDIPAENIKTGVISFEYLQSYTTPDGASVLVPNRARLGDLMVSVFGPNYSQ
ncbi:MAG: LCP family protein [Anaerolineae bacterium]|nr:LCP family protein [Anaerolineae bacterium]MDW8173047.1 LCP family protein [Anaerolineae bacterium]